ncbi:MAG TPA: gluconokinase, GntK/IdnK-type [Acidimicrobiales bacterium]|nr:gluconokinase, GntK/IdnK-type [Acidimicrobiales bacterium]
MTAAPQTLVLTGVSGAGKSTVGRALADRIGAVLLDADDFHPEINRQKMAAGVALTDADRDPWIDTLAAELERRSRDGDRVVLACSALRRHHRARLLDAAPDVALVHLDVGPEELARRLAGRTEHFMPADLLDSQLADLEHPSGEHHAVVDGEAPVDAVVDDILRVAAE